MLFKGNLDVFNAKVEGVFFNAVFRFVGQQSFSNWRIAVEDRK